MKNKGSYFLSVVLLTIAIILIGPKAFSATIYVDAANTSGAENGTVANPYDTIQEGLNAAVEYDTVLVAPGIYYGPIELGQDVKLISREGPATTIIDGQGEWGVVQAYYGPYPRHYIQGFTIRNGSDLIYATNRYSFWQSSVWEIHECVLGPALGGLGIRVYPSASVTITRTVFSDLGVALDSIWCPLVQLTNVTVDNVPWAAFIPYQNAIYLTNTTVTRTNYVIRLWGDYGSGYVTGSNNNFYDYTSFFVPNDRGYPPTINLTNSLYVEPQFVNAGGGDYHLQPASPLIDAGTPVGLPYAGGAPDIGAYEYSTVGIPGQVENLASSFAQAPVTSFKDPGEQRRMTIQNKFNAVLNMLSAAFRETTEAKQIGSLRAAKNVLLNDIWAKADGFFGGNPNDDWITTQEEQARIQEKVMDLVSTIDAEITRLSSN